MHQKLKLTLVGLAAVALAACSGNGSSIPSLQHSGTQTIGHTGGSMAQAGVDASKVHIMRTANMPAPSIDAPQTLTYRGGPVQRTPAIYVVYWGFNVSGSDPSGEQAYMTSFLNGVGHSAWLNTDHQYYQIVGGIHQKIKNPVGQLKNTWVDPSSVPSSPSDSQVQAEARALEGHFGYNKNASYVVATPHNHNTPGFGTQYCAYHGATSSNGGVISYTNLGYMTDAGQNCGQNFVNPGAGGLLDGVSIVEGHELSESQTDPQPASGWYNNSYGEIGDICAWQGLADTTLTTGSFAVQPLWSNSASACVLHSP
jgi:serine protease